MRKLQQIFVSNVGCIQPNWFDHNTFLRNLSSRNLFPHPEEPDAVYHICFALYYYETCYSLVLLTFDVNIVTLSA